MAPPAALKVFGRLSSGWFFRIDGDQLGSKYNIALELTTFTGSALEGAITLHALKNSFDELVPEDEDLLTWLRELPANETLQLKTDGDKAWLEAGLDVANLRLPPSGFLNEASAEDVKTISAGMATALFEELQRLQTQVHDSKVGANRPSGASSNPQTAAHLPPVGSPSDPGTCKQARTAGMTSTSQLPHDDAGGAGSLSMRAGSDDEGVKLSQPKSDDSSVPVVQRHRVVRGRGRGRTAPLGGRPFAGRR